MNTVYIVWGAILRRDNSTKMCLYWYNMWGVIIYAGLSINFLVRILV